MSGKTLRRPTPIGKEAHLSVDHHGLYAGLEVVDIKFAGYSIFARFNGFGIWPNIGELCGFVCRQGYPCPANVVGVVRYHFGRFGVVYRLYVKPQGQVP